MNALRGDDGEREREKERRSLNAAALSSFRRIAAEITNSLAPPPTELAKRQTLHSRLVSERSIEMVE